MSLQAEEGLQVADHGENRQVVEWGGKGRTVRKRELDWLSERRPTFLGSQQGMPIYGSKDYWGAQH